MPTLSSVIVAREAASIAQVDEALARQVVRGGDLGTCLLELGAVSEPALLPLLAEAHGVEASAPGEIQASPPPVLRVVPPAVALRYGIYPLAERGGELHIAVSEPLPQAVEDDLAFALGVQLRQLLAPMVRIRQAIARDYNLPLDRRFARLIARLERRADANSSDPPPPDDDGPLLHASSPVRVPSGTMMVANVVPPPAPVEDPPSRAMSTPGPPIVVPPAKRNTWPGMLSAPPEEPVPDPEIPPGARTPTTPLEAASVRQPPISVPPPTIRSEPPPEPSPPPPPAVKRSGPPTAFIVEAVAATAAQVEKRRRARADAASSKALLGWARKTVGNVIPSDRSPERRRGPLTAADAEQRLQGADTGEQALGIFFAFARQYFEYSALFVVHGDLAAGQDAWGPGASRQRVRAIGVALDLPSALSHARTRGTPALTRLKRAGLDADLRSDLGRTAAYDVLVLPIVMRGRCVALLYGDDGDRPVDHGEIGAVVAMASLLSSTLERVLVRKKRAALRDASAVQNKREQVVDRSQLSPPPPAPSPSTAPAAADLSEIVAKRGTWSEEEVVDDGWSVPSESVATSEQPTPIPPSRAESRPLSPIGRKQSPPPPQVAAVRALSVKPIAREEPAETASPARLDESPEVTVAVSDDAAMDELLVDLELHPSPAVPPASARSSRRNDDTDERPAPPPSTSMAAAPHPPPPPRGTRHELHSVLIRPELVDQVIAGGEKGERALGEILALGEAAIPSVFARFPGPLTVDRNQALGELPRPADCGPVLRIVTAMRRLALPFLAVRSADTDVDVRFWATYLLGELNYADTAVPLLPRLFDENPAVRRIAVRSARSLVASGDEGLSLRKSLERMAGNREEARDRRIGALTAMGELKMYRAIPVLIDALADPTDLVSDAAQRALVAMTRQELGRDVRKWHDWWESKGKKRLA